MKFQIPLYVVPTLRSRVATLSRRLSDSGHAGVSATISKPFELRVDIPDRLDVSGEVTTRSVIVPHVSVEINGLTPGFDRWKIAGYKLARKNVSTAIMSVPVPHEIKDRTICCDHCGTNRNRTSSIVLVDQAGAAIEVGSDCFYDFVGDCADARIARGLSDIAAFAFRLSGISEIDWKNSRASISEDPRVVLAVAHRIILDHGWVNAATSRKECVASTSQIVSRVLAASRFPHCDSEHDCLPLATDYVAADEAIDWYRENASSEFTLEAAAVIEKGHVHPGQVPLIAAAMSVWISQAQRKRKDASLSLAISGSSHVAVIGERVEKVVEVNRVFHFNSQRGAGVAISMRDNDGNLYCWLTSSPKGLREGHVYEVAGTVKAHTRVRAGPSRGAAETQLSRIAIISDLGPGNLSSCTDKPELSEEDGMALGSSFGL